ncbi:transcriptional regulator of NAD metabolism [Fusobacterium sp. PH5-7]|uniref:transcription repressor NadR n=1 Tax=Fusobacterium sp. PH5-7 TaxID=2940528 RepID=UPI0024739961|nr:transcription repressor NadR [Fusobacterium sp. PH5-7]MDH6456416.1 transcriptional regulator of NAD metabolism [Fusobacterium sp. PH5-7]
MIGKERRYEILNLIKSMKEPVSGTELAKKFDVSRQVIVQDIALLRAENYDIFSTTRGYIYKATKFFSKVFPVCHSDNQIEDELNTIVDLGGIVDDVFVQHEIYGNLKAELGINSRRKVQELIKAIENGESTPLKNLTYGKHFHTVYSDSEEVLELIEKELKAKGYLR